MPEVGEEIVGTWLRYLAGCDFVDYNVHIPGGQAEIDVVGINLGHRHVYICEVATHTQGLGYKEPEKTLLAKFERDFTYACEYFSDLKKSLMLWSPVVRAGQQTDVLTSITRVLKERHSFDLELVVNRDYLQKLEELREKAKELAGNPPHSVMRFLQIEESAKRHVHAA